MKCIIIEDQAPAQRVLKKYIMDFGTLELKGTFSDAIQAMDFLRTETVDLIFLDIHLPKLSGLDFLKTLTAPPAVILTTAFPNYAVESYELDVLDYLVKPFGFERFVKAVAKLKGPAASPPNTGPGQSVSFFIKSGYEYIRIESTDVLYIKTDMDYTEIHLPEKKHLSPETLSHWEQRLNEVAFIRVHKSYLVNVSKIEKVAGNQIHFTNGDTVPIGRAYKDDFMSRYIR